LARNCGQLRRNAERLHAWSAKTSCARWDFRFTQTWTFSTPALLKNPRQISFELPPGHARLATYRRSVPFLRTHP
jgi:hypothetical protein